MINLFKDVTTIFLDADDTLYKVRGSVGERYLPYMLSAGIKTTAEEINRVVPLAWKSISASYENSENQHITTHERDIQIWREYVYNVFTYFTDRPVEEELFLAIYEEFAKASSRELNPYITEFLDALRRSGYKTGILTNNDKRIHRLIPDLGLKDHFDYIYCASDIGYKKPAADAFNGVAESIRASSSELAYIGDCPKNDVLGALNAGWKAAWYAAERKDIPDHRKSPDQINTTVPNNVPSISCFSEALRFVIK
jgi:putative hydrolase of the HAD superfamily